MMILKSKSIFKRSNFLILSLTVFMALSNSSLTASDKLGEEEGMAAEASTSGEFHSEIRRDPSNFSSFVDYYTPALGSMASQEKGSFQARLTLALICTHSYRLSTKNYKLAEKIYKDILKEDSKNSEALYRLGNLYLEENENPIPYWEKAASLGHTHALYAMGMRPYYKDVPAEETGKKRLEYLIKAADKGERDAMFQIGWIYYQGVDHVEKDIEKALEYFHLAAAEKEPRALHELSKMYREGEGVEKDIEKAERFENEAINSRTSDASHYLKQGWEAEKEGRLEEAARLYDKAAELGNDQAFICKNLLSLFEDVHGEARSYVKPQISWKPNIPSSSVGFLGGLFKKAVRLLPK